jgi:hypothetical protein
LGEANPRPRAAARPSIAAAVFRPYVSSAPSLLSSDFSGEGIMKPWQMLALACATLIVLAGIAAVVFRYEVRNMSGTNIGFQIIDRWTGTVSVCGGNKCVQIYPDVP